MPRGHFFVHARAAPGIRSNRLPGQPRGSSLPCSSGKVQPRLALGGCSRQAKRGLKQARGLRGFQGAFQSSSVPAAETRQLRDTGVRASKMLCKLTLEQINDWFTIGKTVTNVELLGLPPAFLAQAAREETQRHVVAPGAGPTAQAPALAQAPVRPAAAFGRYDPGGEAATRGRPGEAWRRGLGPHRLFSRAGALPRGSRVP
ncbi:hypothetical protein P7K49_030128 [Saguinus oedipus]|uniref:Uncharacterized protein n=1 Tax=Saguinus oedipus TaxID=9490 RepID=A0ABQ9U1A7_SAGOE|nr:hypothetical protein P7K49_030128 [Saguinus oedipus]